MYAFIQIKYTNAETISTVYGWIGFILAILMIAGYLLNTLHIYENLYLLESMSMRIYENL